MSQFFGGQLFGGNFYGSPATDGNYFNGPFFGGGFFGNVTPSQDGPRGGAWIEPRKYEKKRKAYERQTKDKWREIERDIEDAYADATGQPRKKVAPVVREALAARDPETVRRIAEQLSASTDPAAVALTARIGERIAQIEQLAAMIAEVEREMILARMRDEDEAIALLLMAN